MQWDDILQRIRGGEDERTELGRFRGWAEKDWLESVCAFANTDGGLVVLGVTDDGAVEGVPLDPDEVQERLTNLLQNGLGAPVRARLGRHRADAGWVHWIEVARTRGHHPLRARGRVLVRRGRAAVEPSDSELMELYNAFGLVFTEERILPGTGEADIEFEAFRVWMARRGVDLDAVEPLPRAEELLRAEILAMDGEEPPAATLYGMLCFGREPQRHRVTRGMVVQLAAYAGRDRGADAISVAEARGRLDEQVSRTEDWVRALGRQERYEGTLRRDVGLVPPRALREALVNALVHRDYAILGSRVAVDVFDDRVEVTSPGALPNHKTPESVVRGGPPRSRNEAMAYFMLVNGAMERRGTGFPRMRREMMAFNGTEPLLETDPIERWVRVTLRRKG